MVAKNMSNSKKYVARKGNVSRGLISHELHCTDKTRSC